MTTKTNVDDVIRNQVEAWSTHDTARVVAGYSANVTVLDPLYPEPLTSHEAIATDASSFFRAFPDVTFRVTKSLTDGRTGCIEGICVGTNTGPLPLPTGELPPTNKHVEFSMAILFDLDDQGLIREERRYYDVAGQMMQLGLMQQ